MKCKDCKSSLCSYRASDAEMNCFYERHPDCALPIDMWSNTDWEQVRIQAAIVAMQGVMNCSIDYNKETIAKLAVEQADALIEQLKEK